MNFRSILGLSVMSMLMLSCGDSPERKTKEDAPAPPPAEEQAVTPNLGIGPITSLTLGDIDEALVATGEAEFTTLCTACHKMDKRHVGPPLAGIMERRTPEWIMNMMLNPDQMVKEDPDAKALLAEYLAPMSDQSLTEDQARAILEYLRTK